MVNPVIVITQVDASGIGLRGSGGGDRSRTGAGSLTETIGLKGGASESGGSIGGVSSSIGDGRELGDGVSTNVSGGFIRTIVQDTEGSPHGPRRLIVSGKRD